MNEYAWSCDKPKPKRVLKVYVHLSKSCFIHFSGYKFYKTILNMLLAHFKNVLQIIWSFILLS